MICPLIHFELTIEVLVGYHLMEPFLGILLDLQPRPTHSQLRIVFQNLYDQMTNLIEGLSFATVDRHALPALQDGFSREYKKTLMDSFHLLLKQYEPSKLESVLQIVINVLSCCPRNQILQKL